MAVVLHILRDWEPEFDPDDFLEGARHAIYVVTDLFSAKDAESMKRIMSPKVWACTLRSDSPKRVR
jgi:predicted lipid-binding transport protein (Tim44 family)